MTDRTARPDLWVLALVLLAAALLYAALIGPELIRQLQEWPRLHRDRDFPSYYLAARRLWRGEDLYSGLRQEAAVIGIQPYFIDAAVNPPTFALVTAPLALVSYPVAWAGWQLLSLVALGLSLVVVVRQMPVSLSLRGWITLVCAVVLFPPLAFHLLYTHTELLLLLALVGAWAYLRRGREVPAGILLGLAGAVRLYPLLFLPYLLLRRSWRAFWAAVAAGLGLAGLAALAAGPRSYLGYLSSLRDVVPTLYARSGNLSLWGTVHKVASIWPALARQPGLRDLLALLASAVVVALTLWLLRRPEASRCGLDREYGLLIAAALLASPLSWIYYQVLLYLPLLVLVFQLRQQRGRGQRLRLLFLGLALLAALSPLFGGRLRTAGWQQRVLSFLPTLTTAATYVALAMPGVDPPPEEPATLDRGRGPS